MTRRKTVLVTGAAGALGQVLGESLPEAGWNVRGLDVTEPPLPGADFILGSVVDLPLLTQACEGVAAIVHLGGIANPGFAWEDYLTINIGGTWNVLEAARTVGVPRVIVASSNHAVGYAERGLDETAADVAARPDSLYGVSKASMESLATFYADEYGLQTTSLRIGSCQLRPTSRRSLSSWLSYPDFSRLVLAAIEGPWVGPTPIWGVSNNTRRWWSLDEGEQIGYFPKDNAEHFAGEILSVGDDPPYVGGSLPRSKTPTESTPSDSSR